jgi:hypothetical protein
MNPSGRSQGEYRAAQRDDLALTSAKQMAHQSDSSKFPTTKSKGHP